MARIQESIDVQVPVHTLYQQVTQFEAYPRFIEDIEEVQRTDEKHLHWKTKMVNRSVEWDAEITEESDDQCIAWRNISGPGNAGRVEVQPTSENASRLTMTLETKPEQVPGSMAGFHENEIALRLKVGLARLKDFVEAQGKQQVGSAASMDQQENSNRSAASMTGNASGALSAVASSDQDRQTQPATPFDERKSQVSPAYASAADMSHQNTALHPIPMRHIGEMPQDTSAEQHGGSMTSDATGNIIGKKRHDIRVDATPTAPLDEDVPPPAE